MAKVPKLWQLSLLGSGNKTIPIIVPENCTGKELFNAVKINPSIPKVDGFQLTTAEGEEIQDTHLKRLDSYGVTNKGTINQVFRVRPLLSTFLAHFSLNRGRDVASPAPSSTNISTSIDVSSAQSVNQVSTVCGVSWPSADDLLATPRHLEITEKIRTTVSTNHPDVFGLDDDTRRAIMSCGHAVAPLSLAMHCLYELEKGSDKITCPVCGRDWDFREVRIAACLSEDENSEFEQMIAINKNRNNAEIKLCPKCNSSLKRNNECDKRIICSVCTKTDGKKYEFCWICLRKWKRRGTDKCGNENCGFLNTETAEMLAKCEMKELSGVMCPSMRACPRCFTLVEHVSHCKHIRCPHCKHDFCFICLKKYYRGQVLISCDPAPCQTSSDQQVN